MTTIDPQKVPAFPIYTLKIGSDDEPMTLDGTPVPLAVNDDYVQAGIQAVGSKLTAHGLSVVRVRAIDDLADKAWDMIVSSAGEVIDLTEQQEEEREHRERAQKRNKRLLIAGISALTVLSLGGVGAAVLVANHPAEQVAHYIPKGVGATLPAAPPPEHSTTAAWSHRTIAGSAVKLISDDRLFTADPDGRFTARDPQTGQPVWRGDNAPQTLTAITQGTWAGKEVYAAAERTELRIWPVDMPYDTPSVSPTTISLDSGHTAHTHTETPYIDLGDWYIRVPDEAGKLHNVMIPPGSTVLEVSANGEITTISANTIFTLDKKGKVLGSEAFGAPTNTSTFPTRVWTLDTQYKLLAWESPERVMGVLNTDTGELVFSAKTRAIPAGNHTPIADAKAKTAVIGSVGVRYHRKDPGLVDLQSADYTALNGSTLYVNTNNGPATVDLNDPDAAPDPWANYSAEDPAPVLVTDDAVYVVATQLDKSTVYRSNRQQ